MAESTLDLLREHSGDPAVTGETGSLGRRTWLFLAEQGRAVTALDQQSFVEAGPTEEIGFVRKDARNSERDEQRLDDEVLYDTFDLGDTEYGTMRAAFQAPIHEIRTGKRAMGTPTTQTRVTGRVLNDLALPPLFPWVSETPLEDSPVSVEKHRRLGRNLDYSTAESLADTYRPDLDNDEEALDRIGRGHRETCDQGPLAVAKQGFECV